MAKVKQNTSRSKNISPWYKTRDFYTILMSHLLYAWITLKAFYPVFSDFGNMKSASGDAGLGLVMLYMYYFPFAFPVALINSIIFIKYIRRQKLKPSQVMLSIVLLIMYISFIMFLWNIQLVYAFLFSIMSGAFFLSIFSLPYVIPEILTSLLK